MKAKRLISAALAAAMMLSLGTTGVFAEGETSVDNSLDLSTAANRWVYNSEGDYYALTDVVYCTNPTNPDLQAMNIYVPGAYMNADGTVNPEGIIGQYTAQTAPILYVNGVSGYMEAAPGEVDTSYLEQGYVYVSVGARGRATQDEDGNYTGKSPWGLVDLKAGIRMLKANDEVLAGSSERIISQGTSAGGAMSALLGSTGNCADYDPYLEEMGAIMDSTDDIYAAQCYCPITDLDYADLGYEWTFHADTDFTGFLMPGGSLDEFQQAMSDLLYDDYIEYYNSLNLVDFDGNALSIGEDGRSGSGYDLLMSYIEGAATKYLTKLQNGELDASYSLEDYLAGNYTTMDFDFNTFSTVENPGISKDGWLTWDGTNATITGLDDYVLNYNRRLKACLAFDDLTYAQGENEELADSHSAASHFSTVLPSVIEELKDSYPEQYEQYYAVYAASIGDEELAARKSLINPMNYIGTDKECDTAPYFRIRVGTYDPHTSPMVSLNLALKLNQCEDTEVDYDMVWDQPHGAADYAGELFTWIDSIWTAPETEPDVAIYPDDDGTGSWSWASDYIYEATAAGLFAGNENGCFRADSEITRAEAATVALAVAGISADKEAAARFDDVNADQWYAPYINTAAANGIVSGDAEGTFRPDAPVTRAEFAAMMLAAKGIKVVDGLANVFSDVSGWATDYIATAHVNGLVNGCGNGTFCPNRSITRAEAAVIAVAKGNEPETVQGTTADGTAYTATVGVAYVDNAQEQQKLNVYLPDGEAPEGGWPVIVSIPGGGFMVSIRDLTMPGASYGNEYKLGALDQGFAVISVDYRSPIDYTGTYANGGIESYETREDVSSVMIEDVNSALCYITANAEELGVNADEMFLLGESAGGGIATYIAYGQEKQEGFSLIGVIGLSPACHDVWSDRDWTKTLAEADASDAPIYLATGTHDFVCTPGDYAIGEVNTLLKDGVNVTFSIMPDAVHMDDNYDNNFYARALELGREDEAWNWAKSVLNGTLADAPESYSITFDVDNMPAAEEKAMVNAEPLVTAKF